MAKVASEGKKTRRIWLAVSIGIALLILGATWYVVPRRFGEVASPGAFGDMFGAANAVFSAAAFIGLLLAIFLQMQELSLQRQELKDTRAELSGQRKQLEIQNKTLRAQSFEGTFFLLLKNHNENVDRLLLHPMDPESSGEKFHGRECFRMLYSQLHKICSERSHSGNPESIEFASSSYLELYDYYQSAISHYFRGIYYALKFVEKTEVDEAGKRLYTNILRSNLSSYELVLLLYNCLSELGFERFKPLVEKYALLKDLPDSQLWELNVKSFFSSDAFGDDDT
jgi:hypothetical protein